MRNVRENDSLKRGDRVMSVADAERQKKVEGSRILTAVKEKFTEIQRDHSLDSRAKAKALNEYIVGVLESLQLDPCLPTKEDMLTCIQRWRQKEREERRISSVNPRRI